MISQVKGSEVLTYGGTSVAYALSPSETVRIYIRLPKFGSCYFLCIITCLNAPLFLVLRMIFIEPYFDTLWQQVE